MWQSKKKIIFFIAISFVFVLGFSIRAQETLSRNFLFLLDQGRDMMAVKSIVYDRHLTLIGPNTSLQGVFQGPLWYYLLTIPTIIFSGDPWGTVVLALIISMATLLSVFVFTFKLFGRRVAFVTLFLFVISPEAIAGATYSWNPHPMWLLIVLYIFFFYTAIYRSKKFNIILWPTIGLMFHFQTALAVFILMATLIYFLLFERKIFLNKNFLIGIMLLLLTFLPQILFDLRHNFLMSKSAIAIFRGSEQGLYVGGENKGYSYLIGDHLFSFFNNYSSSFLRDGLAKYLPYLFLIFILLAIQKLVKKESFFQGKESEFLTSICRLLLIIFLLSFIYPFPIRYWFLTGFQSFYLIILGLILSKIFIDRFGKAIIIFIFFISLYYSWQKIDTLYFHPPDDGGAEKIKGKLKAIDYVYKDANGKTFGLLVFTPAVYADAYDYLIWWHGKAKYSYMPHKEKRGTFYLLMETDRSKPWSNKGWLETVIKTGKIVKTATLPTGIIIQKRSIE